MTFQILTTFSVFCGEIYLGRAVNGSVIIVFVWGGRLQVRSNKFDFTHRSSPACMYFLQRGFTSHVFSLVGPRCSHVFPIEHLKHRKLRRFSADVFQETVAQCLLGTISRLAEQVWLRNLLDSFPAQQSLMEASAADQGVAQHEHIWSTDFSSLRSLLKAMSVQQRKLRAIGAARAVFQAKKHSLLKYYSSLAFNMRWDSSNICSFSHSFPSTFASACFRKYMSCEVFLSCFTISNHNRPENDISFLCASVCVTGHTQSRKSFRKPNLEKR